MNATAEKLEIFLATVPGLEPILIEEVREKGFSSANLEAGGVTVRGDWHDVWRANLVLRGASRILVRLGAFPVNHLAKLDKLARRFPWKQTLHTGTSVRVDVTCKKSRIYHSAAAAERIETALREEAGVTISEDADICIKARLYNDICTISIDTSGELLHKRGHKTAVNKAPLRENIAALILRKCGYVGQEPVLDPMCGSGTFVIEAAEIAAGLQPGRSRRFAFEALVGFDAERWQQLQQQQNPATPNPIFYGFDRDAGAVSMSIKNAERASTNTLCRFKQQAISELKAPEGPAGLVVINPPYGSRIGDVKKLLPLYQTLGKVLKAEFKDWRVGLVTNSTDLAQATGLKFKKKKTAFPHGGIPVKLYISAL